MIECDPAACAEIATVQKAFIRDTIPIFVAFILGMILEKAAQGARNDD